MGCCDQRADPGSVLCDQPKSSIGPGKIKQFFSPLSKSFGQMSPGLDLENLGMSFEDKMETANR